MLCRKGAMNRDLDQLYNALLLSLGQEYEYYQELLKAVQEETLLLKRCTPEDITAFNSKNERLLLSIRVAAEMRAGAVSRIAASLHLDEPVSLTQLIGYAQDKFRKNLMDYQEKIADVVRRIGRCNEKNKGLINASLAHINNTINYIQTLTSPPPNYNRQGQIKAGNLQGRLISEAG